MPDNQNSKTETTQKVEPMVDAVSGTEAAPAQQASENSEVLTTEEREAFEFELSGMRETDLRENVIIPFCEAKGVLEWSNTSRRNFLIMVGKFTDQEFANFYNFFRTDIPEKTPEIDLAAAKTPEIDPAVEKSIKVGIAVDKQLNDELKKINARAERNDGNVFMKQFRKWTTNSGLRLAAGLALNAMPPVGSVLKVALGTVGGVVAGQARQQTRIETKALANLGDLEVLKDNTDATEGTFRYDEMALKTTLEGLEPNKLIEMFAQLTEISSEKGQGINAKVDEMLVEQAALYEKYQNSNVKKISDKFPKLKNWYGKNSRWLKPALGALGIAASFVPGLGLAGVAVALGASGLNVAMSSIMEHTANSGKFYPHMQVVSGIQAVLKDKMIAGGKYEKITQRIIDARELAKKQEYIGAALGGVTAFGLQEAMAHFLPGGHPKSSAQTEHGAASVVNQPEDQNHTLAEDSSANSALQNTGQFQDPSLNIGLSNDMPLFSSTEPGSEYYDPFHEAPLSADLLQAHSLLSVPVPNDVGLPVTSLDSSNLLTADSSLLTSQQLHDPQFALGIGDKAPQFQTSVPSYDFGVPVNNLLHPTPDSGVPIGLDGVFNHGTALNVVAHQPAVGLHLLPVENGDALNHIGPGAANSLAHEIIGFSHPHLSAHLQNEAAKHMANDWEQRGIFAKNGSLIDNNRDHLVHSINAVNEAAAAVVTVSHPVVEVTSTAHVSITEQQSNPDPQNGAHHSAALHNSNVVTAHHDTLTPVHYQPSQAETVNSKVNLSVGRLSDMDWLSNVLGFPGLSTANSDTLHIPDLSHQANVESNQSPFTRQPDLVVAPSDLTSPIAVLPTETTLDGGHTSSDLDNVIQVLPVHDIAQVSNDLHARLEDQLRMNIAAGATPEQQISMKQIDVAFLNYVNGKAELYNTDDQAFNRSANLDILERLQAHKTLPEQFSSLQGKFDQDGVLTKYLTDCVSVFNKVATAHRHA